MINRITLLGLLFIGIATAVQAQDLIRNTQKGLRYPSKSIRASRTAELIESRKISKGKFEKNRPFNIDPFSSVQKGLDQVAEAVFLELDQQKFQQLKRGQRDIALAVPVSAGHYFELELTRVDITQDDFKVSTASGKMISRPSGLFYRGSVKGDPGSFAAISIFNGHMRGLISDKGGNYVLGKIPAERHKYVLYNDRYLKGGYEIECGTEDSHIISSLSKNSTRTKNLALSCVGIYIECEFALYNDRGGIIPTVDYVFALFHESATIYFNESIDIEITEIFIWDIADPYSGVDNACDLRPVLMDNTSNFPGYLAHLLTSRGISGGCAYGPNFCGGETYAVSGSMGEFSEFPAFSVEVYLFTHETGHQLGSPHTHACAWNGNNTQLDDCGNVWLTSNGNDDDDDDSIDELDEAEGASCFNPSLPILPPANAGTIMSYCNNLNGFVNFSLGFGSQPGDTIRSTTSAADCLEGNCSCTEFVNRDLSSTNFQPGVYEASNTITVTGTVDRNNHEPVIFRAGNQLTITNLTVTGSSTFVAEAGGEICDYSSPALNDPVIDHTDVIPEASLGPSEVDVSVYPTPFKETFTLKYYLPEPPVSGIEVYGFSGQLLQTLNLPDDQLTADQVEVNLKGLPSGIYHLRIQTASRSYMQKIVKVE